MRRQFPLRIGNSASLLCSTLCCCFTSSLSPLSFFQVIAAEGEQKASRALKEASEVIAESSSALQLRYLQACAREGTRGKEPAAPGIDLTSFCFPPFQTLNSISAEKNSTIIFPLPIDFITHFMKDGGTPKGEKED